MKLDEYEAFWRIHGIYGAEGLTAMYRQPSWVTEIQPGSVFLLECLDASLTKPYREEHVLLSSLETVLLMTS